MKVTAAILTYNAADRVTACLDAVLAQTRAADEIVLIDNASTDETRAIVSSRYPAVRIVRSETNVGCSGGRNLQLSCASHRYVMMIDDDAFLAPDCLSLLVEAAQALPDASILAPRYCYEQDPNLIQEDGSHLHYLGEAVLVNPERRLDGVDRSGQDRVDLRQLTDETQALQPLPTEPFRTTLAGGIAFLIDREAAFAVGGYDESFFFGKTDGDFSLRLTLSGRNIYTVPKAVAYHRMKPRGLQNLDRQIRNRWAMLLRAYSWRTFLVISPALLVYEISLLGFVILKREFSQYVAAYRTLMRDLPAIMTKRSEVLPTKRRNDRDVLTAGFINMRSDLARGFLVRTGHRMLGRFFNGYWRCCRWLLS